MNERPKTPKTFPLIVHDKDEAPIVIGEVTMDRDGEVTNVFYGRSEMDRAMPGLTNERVIHDALRAGGMSEQATLTLLRDLKNLAGGIRTPNISGEYHDDRTMGKVFDALKAATGLNDDGDIDNIIDFMQSKGILFRERQ
jgi:hypothetical protein